jgi:hypothetical protein
MKAIADGRKWMNAYVAKKDKTLGEVAQGLRRLVHKTRTGTKESVNPRSEQVERGKDGNGHVLVNGPAVRRGGIRGQKCFCQSRVGRQIHWG